MLVLLGRRLLMQGGVGVALGWGGELCAGAVGMQNLLAERWWLTREGLPAELPSCLPGCLAACLPGCRWMHRFLRAAPASDSLLGAGMDYSTGKDIRRMVAVQVGQGDIALVCCTVLCFVGSGRVSSTAWAECCFSAT